MPVIYEPKARAAEYAPLAVNLYTGCLHSCGYCYAPGVAHKKRSIFHTKVEPRKDILELLEKDCRKMKGDPREILLCFMCDPYQPFMFPSDDITREALLILEKYEMKVTILTKGGTRAQRDFDVLKRNNWSFGTTMIFMNEAQRRQWEPAASNLQDRFQAVRLAHILGIRTWVSMEPVIDPAQALSVICYLHNFVDHWKVGKVNYHAYIEEKIDWKKFLTDVECLLDGKSYYIKQDLLKVAGRRGNNAKTSETNY